MTKVPSKTQIRWRRRTVHGSDLSRCPSQLEKKQALPPFQPQITDEYGLDNFDTQFTSEPVQLTPDDE